ncbi:uncharacterized protein LOC130980716 [Arachis stenosperma]|uniref:uncharacterized protein LOC130980716 n=1 Tax=Arachis stenosperma TaxID=217475 RepID=UPI0025AC4407|nr:uncharacterized protein LOC130980716 [Arachis stenosperma]
MKIFVQVVDYRLWKIVLEGSQFLTTTSTEAVVSLKGEANWTEEDRKKVEFNAKAINLLKCAISFEKYRRVSRCTTEGESIDELFERFNIIINGLDAMGITYPEFVLVRRILRSLTKE